MTKIQYIDKRFSNRNLAIVEKADSIIMDYEAQGMSLTLRQLYYQFVSKDLFANELKNYKLLSRVLSDARLAGLISWSAMEDRTRNLLSYSSYSSPTHCLRSAARNFSLDLWADQDNYVEVWLEKEALIGVISGVCGQWRVPHFACKGYNSQSEQHAAGQRFKDLIEQGKHVHVLHLGDHDPSGLQMTEDNKGRLGMFIKGAQGDGSFSLHRLALNMDQVRRYNPPPNPAKEKDSRFRAYKKKFGKKSWELDALEPKVISKIIERNITRLVDITQWEKSLELEAKGTRKLQAIAKKV